MGEHLTGITMVFFCHIRTCNDGCNTSKQMKVDLIFIHSTTCISIAPITEYLKKHEHFFLHSVDF